MKSKHKTRATLLVAIVVVAGLVALMLWRVVWQKDGIFIVSRNGDMGRVKLLLFFRPDLVNAKDASGYTPLHCAAYEGNRPLIRLLAEKGADMDAQDNKGLTAIHLAAIQGCKETVETLVAKNASPNVQDKSGMTALLRATQKNDVPMVKALLACRADPNVPDKDGMTSLHWACTKGYAELVRILVDGRANVNAVDRQGMRPLDRAFIQGDEGTVEFLKRRGATMAYPIKERRPEPALPDPLRRR